MLKFASFHLLMLLFSTHIDDNKLFIRVMKTYNLITLQSKLFCKMNDCDVY